MSLTYLDAGQAPEPHAANLLGALGIGLADLQTAAMTDATKLDVSAVAALTTLLDRPGLTLRQLSQVLGITHSGAVRLADRLATRGLLERGTSADARQSPVSLTPTGRRAARTALRARRNALQTLLSRLPAAQRASFADALATVLGGMPDNEMHARHVCRLCEHALCRGPRCPVGAAAHGRHARAEPTATQPT
jgi:DNA-binding MarR family transcriptional regulator